MDWLSINEKDSALGTIKFNLDSQKLERNKIQFLWTKSLNFTFCLNGISANCIFVNKSSPYGDVSDMRIMSNLFDCQMECTRTPSCLGITYVDKKCYFKEGITWSLGNGSNSLFMVMLVWGNDNVKDLMLLTSSFVLSRL